MTFLGLIMTSVRAITTCTLMIFIVLVEKTVKSEHLENCKTYDKRSSPGSHVECMEACLLRKVVTNENITCLMPWMERNSTRGLTSKPFCNTSEGKPFPIKLLNRLHKNSFRHPYRMYCTIHIPVLNMSITLYAKWFKTLACYCTVDKCQ